MARRTDGSDAPMLSVLTFNTGLTEIRLFGAALYEDVPHVIARAAHLAPALRSVDADIVLLQELVPQRVKKGLAAALRDLYPHRAGITEDSRFYGTGLLTLSRYPTEEASCTPFANQTFEEGLFGPRGMLGCTVRAPGLGPCRVINLHATAGGAYRQRRRRGTPDRRSAQIAEAIDAAGASFEGTVVLAGDFNSDPATDPATGTPTEPPPASPTSLPACRRPPARLAPGTRPTRSTADRASGAGAACRPHLRAPAGRTRGRGERCTHRPRRAGGAGARRRRVAPFRPLRPARHAHARLTAGAKASPVTPYLAGVQATPPLALQGGDSSGRMGCSPLAEPGPWCGGGCRLCAPKLRHAKRSPTEHDTTELDHCADRALGERAVSSPPPGPRNPAYPT